MKDIGEQLMDILAEITHSDERADAAYQLAGQLSCELDEAKERIATLEAQAAIWRRAVEIIDQALPVWDGDGIDPEKHHCELTLLNERHRARAEIFGRLRDTEQAQSSNGQAIGGLWQSASADDGMRNMDISDVCGGQTDCEPATVVVDSFDPARFEKAPCYLCGYSGPGYYQPEQHKCAGLYHAGGKVAVDAGALADSQLLDDLELVAREYMIWFSVVYRHACEGEPGGFVAMHRRCRTEPAPTLREATRRLLDGVE